AINELVATAGKPKAKFDLVTATPAARAIIERVVGGKISDAIFGKEKQQRSANIKALKDEALAALKAELGEGKFADHDIGVVFEELQYKAYRKTVLERGVRADGRDAAS
ncbi:MAG: polyribonucleotide nucleotidyltransferase, partial [Opitutaceae bacterium]